MGCGAGVTPHVHRRCGACCCERGGGAEGSKYRSGAHEGSAKLFASRLGQSAIVMVKGLQRSCNHMPSASSWPHATAIPHGYHPAEGRGVQHMKAR